ncbi:PREDICTED: Bardet-Biedl syndrome 5 protein homolog [Dufourea novaeangliae]|uniref:Bardet-Biedl syndrome 5 protein homolog n=1 Tax=Dufourea novaeangliae TaxID=178035 RepID=UPI000767506C|nr:PREDICTED: Bardet-Biedl syndrome 5 protein homolog [Dufourea novaeangliae]
MQLRLGEFAADKLDLIEDTKGNAGIGYNNIIAVNSKTIYILQGKHTQALYILASFRNCRYEFIFTNQDSKSTRHYTSVIGIYRAYTSSRIYREIKLRSGIINEKQLTLLPQETVHSTLQDIWNLSLEQGNIGTFIVTNIRLVWFADMNDQFNVSIPYLVIANITIKNSKFGPTLVIVSTESSGGYILGFRVSPPEKLHILYKEVSTLFKTFEKCPTFGVDYTFEHQAPVQREVHVEQYSEQEDSQIDHLNVFGYYFSEGVHKRKPNVSDYLGLAAEKPTEISTLQNIWELMPQN